MSGCLIFLLSSLTVSGVSIAEWKRWEIGLSFPGLFISVQTLHAPAQIVTTLCDSAVTEQLPGEESLQRTVIQLQEDTGQMSSLKAVSKCLHHRYTFPGQRHPTVNPKASDKNIYVLGKVPPWRKLVNSDSAFIKYNLIVNYRVT